MVLLLQGRPDTLQKRQRSAAVKSNRPLSQSLRLTSSTVRTMHTCFVCHSKMTRHKVDVQITLLQRKATEDFLTNHSEANCKVRREYAPRRVKLCNDEAVVFQNTFKL